MGHTPSRRTRDVREWLDRPGEATTSAALRTAFAEHYQGRHRVEDALWWIEHPSEHGPSGAAPPQQVFLAAVDELEANGCDDVVGPLLEAAAALLGQDRTAALMALQAARASLVR